MISPLAFFLPGFKQPVVGLDIGSHSVKLVQLKRTKRGYRLLNFGVMPLSSEAIVDGAIIDAEAVVEAIQNLVRSEGIRVKNVVTAVSGTSVIVKKINIPVMPVAELEASIHWEAEQYIPFDIEDVNLDFQILAPAAKEETEAKGMMEVLLVAAKKEKIDDYVGLITEAGLNPVIVDVDVFALENCYEINRGWAEDQTVALVDIGASVMNINILRNSVTTFTQDTSIGGNLYSEAIQKRFGLNLEQAEALKMGCQVRDCSPAEVISLLSSITEEIALKIQQSFEFYRATSATGEEIDQIVLSGGCAKLRGIDRFLEERFSVPVEISDPFEVIEFDRNRFDPDYLKEMAPFAAISVGLASRYVGDYA